MPAATAAMVLRSQAKRGAQANTKSKPNKKGNNMKQQTQQNGKAKAETNVTNGMAVSSIHVKNPSTAMNSISAASSASSFIPSVENLSTILASPEQFFAPSTQLAQSILATTKSLYDASHQLNFFTSALPRLHVQNFTPEQISEQLRIFHGTATTTMSSHLQTLKDYHDAEMALKQLDEFGAAEDEEVDEDDDDDMNADDVSEDSYEDDAEYKVRLNGQRKSNKSVSRSEEKEQDDEEDEDDELDDEEEESKENDMEDEEEGEDVSDIENELKALRKITQKKTRMGLLGEVTDEDEEDDQDEEQSGDDEDEDNDDLEDGEGEDLHDDFVDEDGFFTLAEMEKFADDFEDAETDGPRGKNDAEAEIYGGEVDLDADLGEDDDDEEDEPADGEKYDDFFPAPKSSTTLNRKHKKPKASVQFDDDIVDDDDDDFDAMNNEGEEDEEDEEEAAEQSLQNELSKEDFGGYFQRMASHQQQLQKDKEESLNEKMNDKTLTSHQRNKLKLQKQIEELETKLISKKKWDLSGEINAWNRPKDSLLNSDIRMETKGAFIREDMTAEQNETIESMILSRIERDEYDDVTRKPSALSSTKESSKALRGKIVLNEEKSEVSLSKIYENEYLLQQKLAEEMKKNGKVFDTFITSEEKLIQNETHMEITSLFSRLSHALDSLANFNYQPFVQLEDLAVAKVSDSAALREEVVAGLVESEGVRQTANEVAAKKNQSAMVAGTEKEKVEKKRDLKRKKKAFKAKEMAKEAMKKEHEKVKDAKSKQENESFERDWKRLKTA